MQSTKLPLATWFLAMYLASEAFIGVRGAHGVGVGTDGRGHGRNNVVVKRFGRIIRGSQAGTEAHVGIGWIAAVLVAGCVWWWLSRRVRARNRAQLPSSGRPQPNASAAPGGEAPMDGQAPTDEPAQAEPQAVLPLPAAAQTHAAGVTKTDVLRALRADVPHGFRRAQELLIDARRFLKESGVGDGPLQPAALGTLREACHALAAALSEDGWMPAEEIAGNEAAAIDAFLQRFELAFQNWQDEYALVRRLLPQL